MIAAFSITITAKEDTKTSNFSMHSMLQSWFVHQFTWL